MTTRRRFNSGERVALYLASGGRCAVCAAELEAGWHADHVIPYSSGGKTDVGNGQALCPKCNVDKGGQGLQIASWPDSIEPRKWQEEARARFENRVVLGAESDFLCVATPGGGKTLFALMVAHDLLSSAVVGRVVVVCPTAHLKEQWITAAASVGVHLDDRPNREGWETSDFHGSAMTYAQVANAGLLHRRACLSKRTLVILDEVHHAGERQSWGQELRTAFEEAEARLLLTGTPWRDATSAIPFVRYDEQARSRSDYEYAYPRALAEGSCRPMVFRGYDGEINWHGINGDYQTANLKDEIPREEASRRLRTALDPEGRWLRGILVDADAKLEEIRRGGHGNAAGLVIAKDQDHARAIAGIMSETLSERPEVAISDESEASSRITRFRESRAKWMVAVKMVSEGVDVPRLRVGVYATNTIAKLFFNQVVGRFVRVVSGVDEQTSYLYLPSDERLMTFAKGIMEQQAHELREALKEELRREAAGADGLQQRLDLFMSGTSGDPRLDEIVTGEISYSPEELVMAQRLKAQNPAWAFIPDETIAEILRQGGGFSQSCSFDEEENATVNEKAAPKLRKDELKELRSKIGTMAWRVVHFTHLAANKEEKVAEVRRIQNLLNFEIGAERSRWSIADCRYALELLEEWLDGGKAAKKTV